MPMTTAAAARLDRLYRLHSPIVQRVAQLQTRNPHDAQDVAAETWLRAARWLPSLQLEDGRADKWLITITRRAAIDLYRPRRASERPTDLEAPDGPARLPTSPAAEDEALALLTLRMPCPNCGSSQATWSAGGDRYRCGCGHRWRVKP